MTSAEHRGHGTAAVLGSSTAMPGPLPAGTKAGPRLEEIAMHREIDREAGGAREWQPWDRVVADAAPRDHIVQLYQDQAFLNRAVCRFVCAGFANGEGIILVSTLPHWNGFRGRLEAEGVSVGAAL